MFGVQRFVLRYTSPISYSIQTLEVKKKLQFAKTAIGCIVQHKDTVWIGALDFVTCLDPIVSLYYVLNKWTNVKCRVSKR